MQQNTTFYFSHQLLNILGTCIKASYKLSYYFIISKNIKVNTDRRVVILLFYAWGKVRQFWFQTTNSVPRSYYTGTSSAIRLSLSRLMAITSNSAGEYFQDQHMMPYSSKTERIYLLNKDKEQKDWTLIFDCQPL